MNDKNNIPNDCFVASPPKKTHIKNTFRWLWENKDLILSVDKAQKELFLERLEWLKTNGWWHYRILKHNLRYYSTFTIDRHGFFMKGLLLRGKRLQEYYRFTHRPTEKEVIKRLSEYSRNLQVQATKLPCNVRMGNLTQKPTQKEAVPMDKSQWVDEPDTEQVRDMGFGNYLRIVIRTDGRSRGLTIENGQFGRRVDGSNDTTKRFTKNRIFVSLYNGNVNWLGEQLVALAKKQIQTTITN